MKYLIAKEDSYMRPKGEQFLIKDRKYIITSETSNHYHITSEFMPSHAFRKDDLNNFFSYIVEPVAFCKKSTGDDEVFKTGKYYSIHLVNKSHVVIIGEANQTHSFTKEPDHIGLSYKTWFEIYELKEELCENTSSMSYSFI